MNIPENTRPFSLELAQQNHPLITRDGRAAKFIAYVPDVISYHQVLVKVNDEVVRYDYKGANPHSNTHWDLFIAPLGYCEGLPVFVGDKLIGTDDNSAYKDKELIADTHSNNFIMFKWPNKIPVVSSRMTDDDLLKTVPPHESWKNVQGVAYHYILGQMRVLANKAIERSIADGDVIPTGKVKELVQITLIKWVTSSYHDTRTTNDWSVVVLQEYFDSLK